MTDKVFVCKSFINNACSEWVELNNQGFLNQFALLTLDDVMQISMATAMLFAVSWVFNKLPEFVNLRN